MEESDSNRDTNLRLACQAIDGVVVMPGDVFSYNDTLGKRTEAKGYRPGACKKFREFQIRRFHQIKALIDSTTYAT